MKEFKPVIVRWIDAQRVELGVQEYEDLVELEPLPCEILGFVVHENKERIILAQEKWDDMCGFKYVHVIPKMSIVKITELKELKKK